MNSRFAGSIIIGGIILIIMTSFIGVILLLMEPSEEGKEEKNTLSSCKNIYLDEIEKRIIERFLPEKWREILTTLPGSLICKQRCTKGLPSNEASCEVICGCCESLHLNMYNGEVQHTLEEFLIFFPICEIYGITGIEMCSNLGVTMSPWSNLVK